MVFCEEPSACSAFKGQPHTRRSLLPTARTKREDSPFTLHGLNAVLLPEFGWYRIDPRGNRRGVDAQFDPPHEKLAWPIAVEGEGNFREVWTDPLPAVVAVLRGYKTWEGVRDHLPDRPL